MVPKPTVKKETALATYDQMRMRKNFSLGTAGIDPSDVMPSMVKLVQGTTDLDRVKDDEGNQAKVGQFFFYGDKSILDTIEGYVLNLAKVNDPYNNKDNGQPEKMYRAIGIFSDLLTPFVMYFRRGAINTVKNLLGNVFANLRGVYTFKIQIKTEQKKGEKGNYMTPVISIVNKENEPKTLEILEKEARKYEYLSKMAGGIVFTTRELAVAFGLLYLKNSYELKGYNLWMSVYLILKGEHWVNYPLPPPETWNPF